jgi:hypothetical protein
VCASTGVPYATHYKNYEISKNSRHSVEGRSERCVYNVFCCIYSTGVNIIKWSGFHNTCFYAVTTVHNTNRNSRLSRVFSSGCRHYKASSDRQMAWFVSLYFPRADGAKRRARVLIPPRLFTRGETKALAESKVHQISRAWVTKRGWSSSLISNIWRTVMNSGH